MFNYNKLGFFSKTLLNYSYSSRKTQLSISDKVPRILRVICQRPYYTGSGINLINLIKQTSRNNIEQFIIV